MKKFENLLRWSTNPSVFLQNVPLVFIANIPHFGNTLHTITISSSQNFNWKGNGIYIKKLHNENNIIPFVNNCLW